MKNADEKPLRDANPIIPGTWDEAKLDSVQLPIAHAAASAKHVSKEYYARLPVRPIYKNYDVYRPDLEPNGFLEWLQQQQPELVSDAKISPARNTEAEWIKAARSI